MHTAQYSVVPPSRTYCTACGGTPCLEQSAIEFAACTACANAPRLGVTTSEMGVKAR